MIIGITERERERERGGMSILKRCRYYLCMLS